MSILQRIWWLVLSLPAIEHKQIQLLKLSNERHEAILKRFDKLDCSVDEIKQLLARIVELLTVLPQAETLTLTAGPVEEQPDERT